MAEIRRKRTGFTTIELLVVIAIIAILLTLLMGGIMAVWRTRIPMLTTTNDIRNLSQALDQFKTRFKALPPSSLNTNNCQARLRAIWPQINVDAALASLNISKSNLDLQGDQCLVLFLAGRHQMSGGVVTEMPSGFSENPTNPYASPSDSSEIDATTKLAGKRIEPFMKFDTNRFYQRDQNCPVGSYGDGWFKTVVGGAEQYPCYAFFSVTGVTASNSSLGVGNYSDSDCSRMVDVAGGYPRPFVNLNATTVTSKRYQYMNPNSFQIISAGGDTKFGNSYKFPARGNAQNSSDSSDIPNDPAAIDNMTNFYDGKLGDS